jgi:hypothetical protein
MNEKVQSLANNNNKPENIYRYYKAPKFDTMSIVNDYKKIYSILDSAYSSSPNYSGAKILRNIESRNKDFVTTLVQLFEQKMSADEARRERTARTGRLDMRQIANYKFKDNLFLKNTIIPNGKNHGMVMIVDWSSSMTGTIVSVVEQILSMVFFCRRMKIPYEVYAFADRYDYSTQVNYGDANFVQPYGQCFHNFLSSRMSNAEFRKNAAHFCQLAVDVGSNGHSVGGKKSESATRNKIASYGLTGTPLNEAIYNSVDLVNIFRAANKLEIVNVFVLTDGGGCSPICHSQDNNYDYRGANTILIDKKGYQHQLSIIDAKYPYVDIANELNGIVEYAKKTTGANYISIFLSGGMNYPQGCNVKTHNVGQKKSDVKEFWNKNNYISYTEHRGYTESFTIKSNVSVVNNDAFSSLSDYSSDKQIENAFAENMQKKRTSRVFLNRFADLIAKKVLV